MSTQMSTGFTKRELIGKQTLGAGLRVGALALLAQTQSASAQTAFTSFAFPATGAPKARTMPDRLAEIKNVKDFGAIANGVTDDTAAIQAAINAAIAAGGGTVYFPALAYPNYYHVTAPLTFLNATGQNGTRPIQLTGEKAVDNNGSIIGGNFAGYVLDSGPDVGGSYNLSVVRNLTIKNPNAAGGGIRMLGVVTGEIAECTVQAGNIGINLEGSSYNIHVRNTNVLGTAQVGIGIAATQSVIEACSITGWNVGLTASNVGLVVVGSRFEVNNTGLVLGMNSAGTTSTLQGALISGNSTERNNTAINVVSAGGLTILGNALTGTVRPDGTATPAYGMIVGNVTGGLIAGNTVSVYASVAAIDLSGVSGQSIVCAGNAAGSGSGTGVAWKLPAANSSAAAIVTYVGDNGTPSTAITFASLPGQPGVQVSAVEGMEYNITNCKTAIWGAPAAGGGSNHVKVRYNGSTWTVVGI
jgi:hypothetical protein